MKINSCIRPTIRSLLLTGVILAVPCGLVAQPAASAPAPSAAPAGSDYLLDVRDSMLQPRGARKSAQLATLQNLVEALREEYADVNIVITPGIAEITVGYLKLRAASLEDILEALSVASGGQFVWEKRRPLPHSSQGSTFLDPVTGAAVAGVVSPVQPPGTQIPVEADSTLYILREPAVPVESRRRVEAFNLSGYLANSKKPVADSLKEIERIVADTFDEMRGPQGAQHRPTFKFHAGANLLIVVGPPEAIEIARQVVNALPGQEQRGAPYGRPGEFGSGGGAVYGGSYPGAAGEPFPPPRR